MGHYEEAENMIDEAMTIMDNPYKQIFVEFLESQRCENSSDKLHILILTIY